MCTYAEEAWHQEAYSEKEGGKFAEAGPSPVGSRVDTGVARQVSQANHPLRAARRHPRGLCAVGLLFNLLQPSLVRVLKGSLNTESTTTSSGSRRTNHGGAMRSGYSDGPLALGVLGCERPEPFARLLELVGPLDGNPERPCLQQSSEPLQVLLARHSPDVVALRPFTGRRERRGPAPVVL